MSYTEIYGFGKDGKAYLEAEIRNAFRGAMAIWGILEKKYLPPYRPMHVPEYISNEQLESFLHYVPTRTAAFTDGAMEEIWNLFDQVNASHTDKIVLGTTLDNVIVKKENFAELIKAFESFEGETSLKEQADIIKRMEQDDNCIAVGWNQTSVNVDSWGACEYDEETDEDIPYSLNTMYKHWYLFQEVKLR